MIRIQTLLLLLILLPVQGFGQAPALEFITLGTASGPESKADRSQPANALVNGEHVYLVDAGDGAAAQLARAGYRLPQVSALFLSHLHFDHTGGVLAVLGLRMQLDEAETLTIIGPPGTKAFIDGLVDGMEPAREAAFGVPGRTWQHRIAVREMRQGDAFRLDGVSVTVAENSHYQSPEDNSDHPGSISLSYRFDGEGRSIVYTGDTGPSDAVTELAQGADLYVSEMMDIALSLDNIRRINPGMPEAVLTGLEIHFRAHHVTPEQVAAMARDAGVGQVVVTHFGPGISTPEEAAHYAGIIANTYDGPVAFANDLDRF